MIYPTRRAVAVMAAGVPVALAAGLAGQGLWLAGVAWVLGAVALMLADAWLAPSPRALDLEFKAPGAMGLGAPVQGEIIAAFRGGRSPKLQVALGVNDRLDAQPDRQTLRMGPEGGRAMVRLFPKRRGEALFEHLWARWRGPLGLAWVQRTGQLDRRAAVTPDVQGVKDEALRLFTRDAIHGMKTQIEAGDGSDFNALKEFQSGMDLRSIDWKQSARHARLIGKEYRTERNHHIVLAIDSGRLMSSPLHDGAPRLDRAINAALLLAFVSLKMGDRVRLFAFDARPRIASGSTAGAQAFPLLQRLAASIDYTAEETNFTLGLTTLAGGLDRRALVVVFTDFADATSAELMIENVGRLLRTHLVMFVAFRDEALEALVDQEPETADDVSRAVVAARLLKQREVVISRLQRLGAWIVETPAERLGPELVSRYLAAKRKDLL
jgi:uncharacterized protein (DUF58 family)